MKFLAKTFQKDFSSSMSPTEKSTATAFRIMCEEHLYWQVRLFFPSILAYSNFDFVVMKFYRVLVLWWFEYSGGDIVPKIFPMIPQSKIKEETRCWKRAIGDQIMGTRTKEEVTEMAVKDLRALSIFLGNTV